MAKLLDYSRFDHIDTDSDEEETAPATLAPQPPQAASESTPTLVPTIPSPTPPQLMTKKGKEGRLKFEYEGRTIYEWEQSLEEVNIFLEAPPGVPRHLIENKITHKHLVVGLRNTPPFIDEDTGGPVKTLESMWTLSDGEININLQKMNKAEMWECALMGRAGSSIDAFTKEQVRKKLMLERFQEEHPGFDFSGAEFNGQVPDAREFMGGVKYS